MTLIKTNHAIALSDKEFALLETIYTLGSCTPEEVMTCLNQSDLLPIVRMLHDLTLRGLLVRPEIDEQLLYDVKHNYSDVRGRFIILKEF